MSYGIWFPLLRLFTRPFFFFFNDTATTEIYTLSLHDALPISSSSPSSPSRSVRPRSRRSDSAGRDPRNTDRKSTRLNSSHGYISYAVFCLKKKKNNHRHTHTSSKTASYKIPHHVYVPHHATAV